MESLASLFRLDPDRLQALLIEKELGGHPWLRECGPAVIRELADAMVQRLPEALNTPLEAVVAAAFREGVPTTELAEETALPPQRLQSRHRPVLQLQVGDRPLLEVAFEVSLEIGLEGVVLHSRQGRPRAVAIERTQASGLLLHERQVIARFSDAPLSLPPLLPLVGPSG